MWECEGERVCEWMCMFGRGSDQSFDRFWRNFFLSENLRSLQDKLHKMFYNYDHFKFSKNDKYAFNGLLFLTPVIQIESW